MTRWDALLGGLLAVVVALHLSLRADPARRNLEFVPDMANGPAYETQAANPVFPDGKTLQAPPPGTIARGYLPLAVDGLPLDVTTPYKELAPEQVAAWDRLAAPALDPEAAAAARARGAFVFENFCAVCHGAGGPEGGPVTKRGVPPPTPLTGDGARAKSDGRLFRILTAGEGNMPSYATQVAREDRWNVILYVRSLQNP
jgi:mono/diheme cytochrome c family protein